MSNKTTILYEELVAALVLKGIAKSFDSTFNQRRYEYLILFIMDPNDISDFRSFSNSSLEERNANTFRTIRSSVHSQSPLNSSSLLGNSSSELFYFDCLVLLTAVEVRL